MTTRQPRYSAENCPTWRCYIRARHPCQVEPTYRGKVVAIDIDRGVYVIDDNALTRVGAPPRAAPGRQIWCVRVGSRVLHRIGGRPLRA